MILFNHFSNASWLVLLQKIIDVAEPDQYYRDRWSVFNPVDQRSLIKDFFIFDQEVIG